MGEIFFGKIFFSVIFEKYARLCENTMKIPININIFGRKSHIFQKIIEKNIFSKKSHPKYFLFYKEYWCHWYASNPKGNRFLVPEIKLLKFHQKNICDNYGWTKFCQDPPKSLSKPWSGKDIWWFPEITPTLRGHSSVMPASLGTLRYAITIYSPRSRDWRGRKPGRTAGRDSKSSD